MKTPIGEESHRALQALKLLKRKQQHSDDALLWCKSNTGYIPSDNVHFVEWKQPSEYSGYQLTARNYGGKIHQLPIHSSLLLSSPMPMLYVATLISLSPI